MHFIKTLIAKYGAFFKNVVAPLGPWGIFVIAFMDGAALGIPVDPLVAGYVWADRRHFWLYCLMAAAGSTLGYLVVFFIGRKGEEALLEKRIPAKRLETIRDRFERQEFLAVMIPSMLPPPTPFKLIVLSAGALRMKLVDFLAAIFLGRFLRFMIVSLLVIKFGPQIVEEIKHLAEQHGIAILVALAAALVLYLLYRRFFLRARGERAPLKPLATDE